MLISGWNKTAHILLRIGLGVTFTYVGYAIWQNPEAWAGFIQPWAQQLLPLPAVTVMQDTAVFDMIIGVMLIIGVLPWLAAALGALHLLVVIITVGVNDISARDFGLGMACAALAIETLPEWVMAKLRRS